MPRKAKKKGPGVFISHSSVNLEDAKQVEAALNTGGFDVWLDDSDIRVGVLLGKELLKAIEASRAVVLIWSEAAKNSAWVTTEILAAFHLNRFILPYTLDATEFPQLLSRSIHGDLRKERAATLTKLAQDVKRAPRSRNEFPGVTAYQPPELEKTIRELNDGQMNVLDRVGADDLVDAERLQQELDVKMRAGELRWTVDPMILSLAGYHRKNAYMIKHWQEYCAGRFPKDTLLDEGRSRFFETLLINPIDYSALNGLGNILLFQGELDAAEFFVGSAINCAKKDGADYWQANHDLKLIRNRLQAAKPK
jgi:TIR domain